MRTLQAIASKGLGGAENSFLRLVDALTDAGHQTATAVRADTALSKVLAGHGDGHTVPMRNYADLSTSWRLWKLLRDGEFPVVQTWASRATWLTRPPRGVAHVARLGGRYRTAYFRHADAWVVNTAGLRDWMISRGFPAQRVVHINNFVPAGLPVSPLSRPALGLDEDVLLSGALGRLVTKKGFDVLLEAMAALPAQIGGREHHLLLMGDGPLMADLKRQANTLGLDRRVHFAGWLEHADAALQICDLMVCPSRVEPLGNVILEAWNRRKAVVSTATDGGRELIRDGETGVLCAPGDADTLARVWRQILRDADLRAQLAVCGHAHFAANFSPQATVAAYLDLYQRLTRGHLGARLPSTSV